MKNKNSIKIVLIALFIIITIFKIEYVSSAVIGISPSNIVFKDVLRGGYAERYITITSDSDYPIFVNISSIGQIKDWINLSNESFEVSRQKPYRLKISVNPPIDIPNGNYTGFIRVSTDSEGQIKENKAIGFIKTALDLNVLIQVTDFEFSSCSVKNYEIISAEKGDDLILKLEISNTGNIRLNPIIEMEIWDENQLNIIKKIRYSEKQILPTTTDTLLIMIPTRDLEIGQYWLDVYAISCYDSRLLTFDVYEPGSLKANGILKEIIAKVWVNEKENVPITVLFQNIGEKPVTAAFKGTISYEGKIIQLLESEPLLVDILEDKTFQFYFTPQKPGKYIISGRVFYEKKRTYEKSAIVNVKPSGPVYSKWFINIVYLILVILIIYLLFKIKKEKKRISEKIRRVK